MREKLLKEMMELIIKLTDTPGWTYSVLIQGIVDYLCDHYEIVSKK